MADFCHQCSVEQFGEDFRDLANLSGPHPTHAICEGCGPTIVDASGNCTTDCLRHHCHSEVRKP